MALALLLHNLGTLANDRGDPGRADDYFEQALGEARQMGDRAQASRILANLGALHNRDHRAGASPGGLLATGCSPFYVLGANSRCVFPLDQFLRIPYILGCLTI